MSGFSGGGSFTVDDAQFNISSDAVIGAGFLADEVGTDSVDEGDKGIARMTLDRKQIFASNYTDGSAMTAGSSYVSTMGAVVDDVSTSAVAEGSVGSVRMGADRILLARVALNNVTGARADLRVDGSNRLLIASGTAASDIAKLEDSAHTSGDVGVFVMTVRTDTAASSAGTTGDYAAFSSDSLGHLWTREGFADGYVDNPNAVAAIAEKILSTSSYSPTSTQNNSFTTTNIKATSGNIYGFTVHNTTGTDRYFQIHNTATTPGGGGTAAFKWLVPAGTMLVLGKNDWGGPLNLSTGIAIANSTALTTYTAGTAGDLVVDIQWK